MDHCNYDEMIRIAIITTVMIINIIAIIELILSIHWQLSEWVVSMFMYTLEYESMQINNK